MSQRLKDKVAIVFGAGSDGEGWGNGKAAAVKYAQEGASVVAVDLNQQAAEETRNIILEEGGISIAITADVTNSIQIKNAVDKTIERFGKIDVLHNNVGITKMGGPVELSEEDWKVGVDVNLNSVFLTMKHVIPHMTKNGSGSIINISSIASIRYIGYDYPVYAAAKAALNQLTASVAIQYADQGIRVNAILPGFMDTPLIYKQISDAYDSVEDMIAARHAVTPMGHMGTAWDVANAAVFLASDESKFITGVSLPVDGGQSIRSM
ncbi:SDR family NAD(P)-dependent oxidoreductase [Oceanobacillus sp. AG]|uniref:SDR family NAD(P)-dependent oxidoreductase n=1 Tax=Oceanobacillus sp. AG TaxID=2681969 RepID=UPI0012EC4257|nr:SDR family oxidoreductase [Oceanobacillus sp. AG]